MRTLSFMHTTLAATAQDGNWLSADAFAQVAEIKERMGRKALMNAEQGKTWKGHILNVRTVPFAGGKSGERYEVLANSLPPELYQRWIVGKADQPMPVAPTSTMVALEPGAFKLNPLQSKHTDEAYFRMSVIRQIIECRPRTPERTAAVNAALALTHQHPDGTQMHVRKSALYEWVASYEARGMAGLAPARRSDIGQSRTIISRKWDATCPIDSAAKLSVAGQLQEYIRSLWARGTPGRNVVQELATTRLLELSRQAGWQGDNATMKAACQLSRTIVEAERLYGLMAINDQDAKQFFDHHLPRVIRSRAGMQPMDVVVGDVHPIDVGVMRPDGSIAYPRAIAWLDVATNRTFFTLVLLDKGQGIRQVDVAQSFASMCEAWGLPKKLYLDNGSEYSWREMMMGFQALSQLADTSAYWQETSFANVDGAVIAAENEAAKSAVIRARPYNAPAKPIEGIFSVLEGRVFAMLPGWVGGNRMKKKTHNVGREPMPFPGTWEDFHAAMAEALTFYHQSPQKGSLAGLSPQQAYESALANGWGKVGVSEQVLMVSFAKEEKRLVRGGYLDFDGTTYYDDSLLCKTGLSLTVRVARHDPRFAFVFDDAKNLLCAAGVAQEFPFVGDEGPKEQARRNKVLKRHISVLRANVNSLDMVDEMKRHNSHSNPMPEAPVARTVELSGAVQKMVEALNEADLSRLPATEKKAPVAEMQKLSQWHSPTDIDPYTSDLVYLPDEGVS